MSMMPCMLLMTSLAFTSSILLTPETTTGSCAPRVLFVLDALADSIYLVIDRRDNIIA